MDNSKAQEVLERVEVVVPVKQRMALSQTESSNDAVDRFPEMVVSPDCRPGGTRSELRPIALYRGVGESLSASVSLSIDGDRFHRCLFSPGAAAAHGVAQQLIIDFDICAHSKEPRCVRIARLACTAQGPTLDRISVVEGAVSSVHPICQLLIKVTALHFVIPSELRISYHAALTNDHVCGVL